MLLLVYLNLFVYFILLPAAPNNDCFALPQEVQVSIGFAEKCMYQGVVWDRVVDIYDERPHCGLENAHEHWIADVLQPILLANFPPFPPDRKLAYKLLLPREPLAEDCDVARLIACSAPDKEHATWKEVVVYKHRKLLHMYNLVSHGRKMYRVLVYTSHHGFSLAALSPNFDPKARAVPAIACKQAGHIRQQRGNDASLVVQRRSPQTGQHEVLLPRRLLAGLVPDALLSSHRFYHGEDGVIRGSPLSLEDDAEWFGYDVKVAVETDTGRAHVFKMPLRPSPPSPTTAPTSGNRMPTSGAQVRTARGRTPGAGGVQHDNLLARSSSLSQPADAGASESTSTSTSASESASDGAVKYRDHDIAHLTALGFTLPAVKLALRRMRHIVERAAQWLLDPDHQSDIEEVEKEAAEEQGQQQEESTDAARGGRGEQGARAGAREGQDSKDGPKGLTARLLELGYSEAEARFACTSADTMEGCLEWLSKGENRAQALEAAQQPASLPSRQHSAMSMSVSSDTFLDDEEGEGDGREGSGELTRFSTPTAMLLNLLDAPKGTFLYRLATLIVRIEDLSHVLVWSSVTDPAAQECPVALIELPRLKVCVCVCVCACVCVCVCACVCMCARANLA